MTTLTCRTRIDLIPPADAGIPPAPVRVALAYDPAEPFAVRVVFGAGSRGEVPWIMSRDLLVAGVETGAGEGDVAIHPMPTRPGYVELTLRTPEAIAHFAVRAATLQAFLRRTYAAVPPGRELAHVDVDAGLAALLDREAHRG